MRNGKLLVVGGSGMLGTVICRKAIQRGVGIISVSRSGKPPPLHYENVCMFNSSSRYGVMTSLQWMDSVNWLTGSARELSDEVDRPLGIDSPPYLYLLPLGFGAVHRRDLNTWCHGGRLVAKSCTRCLQICEGLIMLTASLSQIQLS